MHGLIFIFIFVFFFSIRELAHWEKEDE